MYREPCSSTLQKFVQDRVTQKITPGYSYEEQTSEWSDYLFGEKQKIIVAVHMDILKLETHESRQTYIESQQAYFSTQIGSVMDFLLDNEERMPPALVDGYNRLAETLQSILTQIQVEYRKYFDLQREISRSHWLQVRKDLQRKIHQVRSRMQNPLYDARLRDLALRPYEEWCKEYTEPMNYEQLMYANTFFRELLAVDLEMDVDCQMRNILVKLNFNTEDFFNYAVDNMNGELANLQNWERLEKLAEFEKIFSLLKMKTGNAFTNENTGISDFLMNLVHQERLLIENIGKINASSFALSPVPESKEAAAKPTAKILFSEPLNVLAGFSKAMEDAGVISADKTMDIIRAFVGVWRTKNKEDLSEESFRQRFYNIEPSTKLQIIRLTAKIADSAGNLKTSKSALPG